MAIKHEETTIGETQYRVRQLPAGKARKLLTRMFGVAGPALGALIEKSDGASPADGVEEDDEGQLDTAGVASALTRLALDLKEDDLEYIVGQLFDSGCVDMRTDSGDWLKLSLSLADAHFTGALAEQFKLIGFALKVNYGDFLGVLGAAKGKLKRPRPQTTPTSSNSQQT